MLKVHIYPSEKMTLIFFAFSIFFSLWLGYPIRWGSLGLLLVIFAVNSPVFFAFWFFFNVRERSVKFAATLFFAGLAVLIVSPFLMQDLPGCVSLAELLGQILVYASICLGVFLGCVAIRTSSFKGLSLPSFSAVLRRLIGFIRHWLPIFLIIFSYLTIKSLIPVVTKNIYDPELRYMDFILFFKHDPIAWCHQTFPARCASFFSFGYSFFFILQIIGYAGIYSRYPDKYYFRELTTALCLCYVLGLVFYYALPSLGPAFYTPSEFTHLPPTEMDVFKTKLWRFYVEIQNGPQVLFDPDARLIKGIAAFPSLHIAVTVLILHYVRRHIRKLFIWLLLPSVLLFVATLYFGWHYVVDDIGGVFLAGISIWIAAKFNKEKMRGVDPDIAKVC